MRTTPLSVFCPKHHIQCNSVIGADGKIVKYECQKCREEALARKRLDAEALTRAITKA